MQNKTIGEMVVENYRKADVFKKFGLDFCCGGKKTINQVCTEKGIDLTQLEKELALVDNQQILPSQDFNSWNLAFLIDYIVNTHHRYVAKSIPVLFEYLKKVAKVHGDGNPETKEILNHFMVISDELNRHMMKEENILFPYIKQLSIASERNLKVDPPPFGTVENPIRMMEMEHETAGDLLEKIREISSNYTPPEYACNTFRVSYAKLKEFEDDLHQHIHLENNILFPKAIQLEKLLLS